MEGFSSGCKGGQIDSQVPSGFTDRHPVIGSDISSCDGTEWIDSIKRNLGEAFSIVNSCSGLLEIAAASSNKVVERSDGRGKTGSVIFEMKSSTAKAKATSSSVISVGIEASTIVPRDVRFQIDGIYSIENRNEAI